MQKADKTPIPEKLAQKIVEVILPQLASKLIHEGKLKPSRKVDPDYLLEALRAAKDFLGTHNVELGFIDDHRPTLLAKARACARQADSNLAAVFYGTYFEHQLNGLIADGCERRGLSAYAKQIIREANLAAKCTWVMALLGLQPIKSLWRKRILEIADLRNTFIHYKWTAYREDQIAQQANNADRLKFAERTVRYLQRYEDRALHFGQGASLRQIIKKRK